MVSAPGPGAARRPPRPLPRAPVRPPDRAGARLPE